MDGRIGDELRQEREARGIELDEVEAATGIRARFLAAIEDEDWEQLPGEFYARAFTRTYASYLGLDQAELALEHRPGRVGEPKLGPRVEPRLVPGEPSARKPRAWRAVAAVAGAGLLVALVAAILIAALGGGGSTRTSPQEQGAGRHPAVPHHHEAPKPAPKPGTSLRLTATAEVWVCLLDAAGKPLIDGEVMQAGSEAGPFRSRGYAMSFGNGAIELRVDGARAHTPESSSPVGYAIAGDGKLSAIPEGERPECT